MRRKAWGFGASQSHKILLSDGRESLTTRKPLGSRNNLQKSILIMFPLSLFATWEALENLLLGRAGFCRPCPLKRDSEFS